MAKLTTRSLPTDGSTVSTDNFNKGTALTHSEMDSNFLNLNNNKLEITGPQTFTGDLTVTASSSSAVGSIILPDNDASLNVSIKSPATLTETYSLALPVADGTANQVMTTNGSGQLQFQSIAGDITQIAITAGTGLSGSVTTATGDHTQTLAIDSTVATLTGSQTLTTKSIDADNNTITNLELDNLKADVLDTDISTVAGTDTTIASAKAIKTYVDAQIATKDNTDEITEGSSNLYFTNARADARISAASITDLSDVSTSGVSNGQVLAYNSTSGNFEPAADTTLSLIDEDNFSTDSDTRPPSQQSVKAYIATQIATKDNSDEITEGSTNLYFTNARADARADVRIAAADTDSLSEGSSNLYHTTARARGVISASGSLAYNSSTGALTYTQGAIDADSVTVSNLEVDNFKAATIVLASEGIGSNDNDTTLPTSAAVKAYADSVAGGSSTLAGLTDTTITSVADNEVLAYDNTSSKFINQTPAEANLVDISSTQTISGNKTYSGTNHFDGRLEIDDKLRVKDDEYLTFGDDDDVKMRFKAGSTNRFEIDVSDTSAQDKGFLRLRADNTIDIQAGKDRSSKGDLLLTSYDDFQFKKGFMTKTLGNVTATGSSGSLEVTLSQSLTTPQAIALNEAENLQFIHSTGTGGDAIGVVSVTGTGSSTVITLEEDGELVGNMSGVTAELVANLRATKFVIETTNRDTPSAGITTLQNRSGQEGTQDNRLVFESIEYNDGSESFSNTPGQTGDAVNRPVKYTLQTTADKNTFTLTHQRTAADTDTDTEIFKIKKNSTETSTVASPTSPDIMAMNVDFDLTTKTLFVPTIKTTATNGDMLIKPEQTGATGNNGPQGNYGWNGGVAHFNSPVTIGTTDTADHSALYNAGLQITSTHESYPAVALKAKSDNSAIFPNVWFLKSNSDTGDATCDDGDTLGGFYASGYSGSNYNTTSGAFFIKADGDHSGSNLGGSFEFKLVPNGSTSQGTIMEMYDDHIDTNVAIKMGEVSKPSAVADHGFIYTKNDSGTGEVFVLDAADNETKISPHNEAGEWEYYSKNTKTGKTVRINMEKMIKDIESLTGNKYIENK